MQWANDGLEIALRFGYRDLMTDSILAPFEWNLPWRRVLGKDVFTLLGSDGCRCCLFSLEFGACVVVSIEKVQVYDIFNFFFSIVHLMRGMATGWTISYASHQRKLCSHSSAKCRLFKNQFNYDLYYYAVCVFLYTEESRTLWCT